MIQHKLAGHTFLAHLGKKRLRPGGVEATSRLFQQGHFTPDTKVLEVACNMGTTAIELAHKYHCSITGVDLDKNALAQATQNVEKAKLWAYISLQRANATQLPFEDNSFDVLINEAMLTMLPMPVKIKALNEYFRVLKPGGRLLTHDIAFLDDQMEQLLESLSKIINVQVSPLGLAERERLFEQVGFENIKTKYWPMSLMSPWWMIRDEGLLNTLKILRKGMQKENRAMFKSMATFFNKTGKDLRYIAIASTKKL